MTQETGHNELSSMYSGRKCSGQSAAVRRVAIFRQSMSFEIKRHFKVINNRPHGCFPRTHNHHCKPHVYFFCEEAQTACVIGEVMIVCARKTATRTIIDNFALR